MTTDVPFLDLGRRVASERAEIDATIARVLDRGRFVLEEEVRRFEDAFAAYCGARHAVGVASGTDAITIALRALGIGPGDEVIVPANSCVPSVAGVEAAGARPVLADAEPHTFGLDPERLEQVVTPRTKAVLVVHLYGQCAEMTPLVEIARRRGLLVVEDAAHAHGATYRGSQAGTLGDAAAFSFYPTKNLGALGDGGAVVTNDAAVAERARLLRSYGMDAAGRSIVRGTNSRLDAIQAAVLGARMARLGEATERRRALAVRYDDGLAGMGLMLPGEADERRHVYHQYVVRSRTRDRLREELRRAGVGTRVHYPLPVHRHPAYASLDCGFDLRVSEALCASVLSLPLYPELTDDEQERVVRAVRATARASRRIAAPSAPR